MVVAAKISRLWMTTSVFRRVGAGLPVMDKCFGCLPVTPIQVAAEHLGVSRREIGRLLETKVLVRINRVLVVGSCVVEHAAESPGAGALLRLDTLLARFDDAFASHESAAIARGLPVLTVPLIATVTRPQGAWRGGPEERVRIAQLPAHHVDVVEGRRVTSIARTVVDIARTCDLARAVVVGDAALRRGLSRQELCDVLDECAQWAEVRAAGQAVMFLDPRAESPFESLSRVRMHEYDVPTPELQMPVRGASGRDYRADFGWRKRRLIGEADGRAKYLEDPAQTTAEVLYQEKLREDDLREAGWDFVRWGYRDMLRRPEQPVGRIMRKLLR